MLVKMEGFITEAVCSCAVNTKITETSQETPVSCSLKQNDRSCNQSKVCQSPVATK